MSLNWDATNCTDCRAIGVGIPETEQTFEDKIEGAKTEHIIMASMLSGLGKKWSIEPEDVPEVYARMHALELSGILDPVRAFAPEDQTEEKIGNRSTTEYPITYQDIEKRIGLRVNVSQITRNQFYIKIGQSLMDRARYGMPADVARKFKAYSR